MSCDVAMNVATLSKKYLVKCDHDILKIIEFMIRQSLTLTLTLKNTAH